MAFVIARHFVACTCVLMFLPRATCACGCAATVSAGRRLSASSLVGRAWAPARIAPGARPAGAHGGTNAKPNVISKRPERERTLTLTIAISDLRFDDLALKSGGAGG